MGVQRQGQSRSRGRREVGVFGQDEIVPGDVAHVGVLPLFDATMRKAERLEARGPGLATRGDPGGLVPALGVAFGQTIEKALFVTHAAESSTTQS
ncbi:hypothetical protein A8U91_01841 [Halomonas elongata]|uniref:Uncharacterized protein n=1 Tax=Halomonas elongata TaxID=2746 RepID=A0A1B8P5B7_HALEL|nr:hypothetical protein A8U91_01841 [Halomonas elongata]